MTLHTYFRRGAAAGCMLAAVLTASCRGPGGEDPSSGQEVVIQVPRGAPFVTVLDTLESRDLVEYPLLFRVYTRLRGADRNIRSGSYAFPPDASWARILRDLTEGRILTVPLTIPEGFTLRRSAARIAEISGAEEESVLHRLESAQLAETLAVPGPTLEGYLFPDTYRFAPGTSVRNVVGAMVDRYHAFWTPERRARLDSLEMTEKELVTLASVVQAEARITEEMDTIASVYHNRVDVGMPLEADPTVLYALGGHRERLLYAAMDSVADNPYNTYTHPGLPPGPIGSPGEEALDATLWPARTDFLFFVARGDGSHVFSRTFSEHSRAVNRVRREQGR